MLLLSLSRLSYPLFVSLSVISSSLTPLLPRSLFLSFQLSLSLSLPLSLSLFSSSVFFSAGMQPVRCYSLGSEYTVMSKSSFISLVWLSSCLNMGLSVFTLLQCPSTTHSQRYRDKNNHSEMTATGFLCCCLREWLSYRLALL